MGLVVTLDGDDAADELRSLRTWLVEEDELRGCVQTRESPPAAGHLGPVLDALEIVADPAAGVLGAAIVAWLKTRVGNVRLVVTASGGETITVEAKNVRGLNPAGVTELTEQLSRAARGSSAEQAVS
ncbi:MAG: effector-associated constant component EACC1 [Pseudonocardiaceae bacterium]